MDDWCYNSAQVLAILMESYVELMSWMSDHLFSLNTEPINS